MPGEPGGLAAGDRHRIHVHVAVVLGGECDRGAIGRELREALDPVVGGEARGDAAGACNRPQVAGVCEHDVVALDVGLAHQPAFLQGMGGGRESGECEERGGREQQGALHGGEPPRWVVEPGGTAECPHGDPRDQACSLTPHPFPSTPSEAKRMKRFPWLPILFAVALIPAGAARGAGAPPADAARPATAPASGRSTLFRAVRVFDGERVIASTDVLVRSGVIERVAPGQKPPAGAGVVEGAGKTLLPGFIDAHTHVFRAALTEAIMFGVTTELDMFMDVGDLRDARAREARGNVTGAADLRSAGTLVTAPGGHGTEYGIKIPTLASPESAQAFVDARLAEGSDYIKIVYDDGKTYRMNIPTLSSATLQAVIEATHRRGRIAVVHIGSQAGAREAIGDGADGLAHLFVDTPPAADFAAEAKRHGAFVIPTLSVNESVTGVASGAKLADDPRLAPYLSPAPESNLKRSFPRNPALAAGLSYAQATVRGLDSLGVPILAGTDAPNPGTAHGVSIHRELELLVDSGLTPAKALTAATAAPARIFRLEDRGRIAEGLRADLVLVNGDPTRDILASRDIAGVWKRGVAVDRAGYRTRNTAAREEAQRAGATAAAAITAGTISEFDEGTLATAFGGGWSASTDQMVGGKSEATLEPSPGGARGTAGALSVRGTIAPGLSYAWAGAMFTPGAQIMTPADLSSKKEIVFWAKGDGKPCRLMVFTEGTGRVPLMRAFEAGAEWKEIVVPFSALGAIDGHDVTGILLAGGPAPGSFAFQIDGVRLRLPPCVCTVGGPPRLRRLRSVYRAFRRLREAYRAECDARCCRGRTRSDKCLDPPRTRFLALWLTLCRRRTAHPERCRHLPLTPACGGPPDAPPRPRGRPAFPRLTHPPGGIRALRLRHPPDDGHLAVRAGRHDGGEERQPRERDGGPESRHPGPAPDRRRDRQRRLAGCQGPAGDRRLHREGRRPGHPGRDRGHGDPHRGQRTGDGLRQAGRRDPADGHVRRERQRMRLGHPGLRGDPGRRRVLPLQQSCVRTRECGHDRRADRRPGPLRRQAPLLADRRVREPLPVRRGELHRQQHHGRRDRPPGLRSRLHLDDRRRIRSHLDRGGTLGRPGGEEDRPHLGPHPRHGRSDQCHDPGAVLDRPGCDIRESDPDSGLVHPLRRFGIADGDGNRRQPGGPVLRGRDRSVVRQPDRAGALGLRSHGQVIRTIGAGCDASHTPAFFKEEA